MKNEVRVSVCQFAPKWLECETNAKRMSEIIEAEARDNKAELIVFPELANTGYLAPFHGLDKEFARKFINSAEHIPGPTTDIIGEVAKNNGVYVIVGIAQKHTNITGGLFNSAVLIGPSGRIIGIHHKIQIPAGEKHYFIPGDSIDVYKTELGVMGMTVCYDGRVPEITRILALKGAEIVTGIWCRFSNLTSESNRSLAFLRAQENAIYYIFCNRTGTEGNTKYIGYSAIGAPNGELIATSDIEEEEIIRATLTNDKILESRIFLNIYRDRRPELYHEIVKPLSTPYKKTDK